jgi:tRNA(fMet)-specific endonuclease VapC
MQYLLDTSICVFFLRGELNLNERILKVGRENCFIFEVTVFELTYGAENSSNPKKSHKAVKDFLNGLTVLPIYESVDTYAKEKTRLRKQGTPMHDEFDLLIGVSALKNKLTLVTDNEKDFRFLEGLIIENWKVK